MLNGAAVAMAGGKALAELAGAIWRARLPRSARIP